MTAKAHAKEKTEIIQLLKAHKNNEAANQARALAEKYVDDADFPMMQGAAFINMKKYDKAVKVLERAAIRFPSAWELLSVLGDAHGHLGNFSDAEGAYRRSLAAVPESLRPDRAEQHCLIAEVLWAQHHREGALEQWRTALEVYPKCKRAQRSLEENTNEYGEARAPSTGFDDLYHFVNIHRKRYFTTVGRSEFETLAEAERVQKMLMDAWNEHVTPHARQLDNMTAAEKTALFEGVAVDFGG